MQLFSIRENGAQVSDLSINDEDRLAIYRRINTAKSISTSYTDFQVKFNLYYIILL